MEIPKKLTKTQRDALKKFEDTLKDDNYEQRKGFFKSLRDKFENAESGTGRRGIFPCRLFV